jgi:hypothetical protein
VAVGAEPVSEAALVAAAAGGAALVAEEPQGAAGAELIFQN